MTAQESFWVKFAADSAIQSKVEFIFSEPKVTSSQGPTLSYSPPPNAIRLITEPNSTPIRSVQWSNLDPTSTSRISAEQSFTTALRDSRVNPTIMRMIPWAAMDAPLPLDVAQWRRSETYIPTDAPEIRLLLNKAFGPRGRSPRDLPPWDAAKAVFLQVAKSLSYDGKFDGSPQEAFDKHRGQCGQFAWLFVAALRNLGFAARICAGWRTGKYPSDTITHVWAEFYMPGVGWVPADPTDSQGIDPTGTYAYHFGTVPDLNARTCVSLGGDLTWPDTSASM